MASEKDGSGQNRFERVWNEWDAAVEKGKEPRELLSEFSSEKIMQLLAGAGNERRYERDILATEAMNRLVKARRRIEESTQEVADLVHEVQEQGQKTREDVHATEDVVGRLQGSERVGVSTPQEITAHSASDLVENLMSVVGRTVAALERLEEVRGNDLERALGGDAEDEGDR